MPILSKAAFLLAGWGQDQPDPLLRYIGRVGTMVAVPDSSMRMVESGRLLVDLPARTMEDTTRE